MFVKNSEIAGVVLAGGKSSRFGTNKAFARFSKLDGQTFIEKSLAVMNQLFETVLLVTNTPQVYESIPGTSYHLIQDEIPDQGPLGGIVSAFHHCKHNQLFVVACDMPLLETSVICEIISKAKKNYTLLPYHDETNEYLMALYDRTLLPELEKNLQKGQRSLKQFFQTSIKDHSQVLRIPINTTASNAAPWLNINTQDDLLSLRSIMGEAL